jgi:hypothetical protein
MKNTIIFLIGITLFVLVLIGISITIYVDNIIHLEDLGFMPIIIFTGFFIFIIAAILVGLSLFKIIQNK